MHKARLDIAFRHNWILTRNDCIEEKSPTYRGRLLPRVSASCLFAIGPWGDRTRKRQRVDSQHSKLLRGGTTLYLKGPVSLWDGGWEGGSVAERCDRTVSFISHVECQLEPAQSLCSRTH